MNRLLLFVFAMHAFACATIVRGARHDVTIYGPKDLQVYDGARPVELKEEGEDGGRIRYTTAVDRHTKSLTLKSPSSQDFEYPLTEHVSAGYAIADFFLIWPIAIPVDWATGNWSNFDDINAASLAMKPAAPSFAPAPQQAAPRALAAAPPAAPARKQVIDKGVLAVLDFRNFAKDLQPEDVRYFADLVRGATLRAAPNLKVMTRENLLVLLQATGKDAANCEGECEVDTGRRIGADAVISGEILKVGTHYKMSLKLHETREGRLLATTVASGKTIDELDESAQAAAEKLLAQ